MPRGWWLSIGLAGCAAAVQVEPPAPFEDRLLDTIPEDVTVLVPPVFNRDGTRFAYVARREGMDRVVSNGAWGPPLPVV
jgi:hypothetical protein